MHGPPDRLQSEKNSKKSRDSQFSRGYGNKGKGSGELKCHGFMTTQDPTIIEKNLLILEGQDRWKIRS